MKQNRTVNTSPNYELEMLSSAEVGRILALSTKQVVGYIRSGELRGFKVGAAAGWRVQRKSLEEFIQRYLSDGPIPKEETSKHFARSDGRNLRDGESEDSEEEDDETASNLSQDSITNDLSKQLGLPLPPTQE